jgi:predicted nucleotidyltransferase
MPGKIPGHKKGQYLNLKPPPVFFLAPGGQGDSFRENRPPGPPVKAFDSFFVSLCVQHSCPQSPNSLSHKVTPRGHEEKKKNLKKNQTHGIILNRITKMSAKITNRKEFEPIIYELNSELKKRYDDFVGITFFGSRCRGDFSEESDFDVVILFAKKPGWQKESDVLEIVLEKELKYNIVIDAKIYHEAEIKKQNTPFRVTVCQEGAHYGV